MMNNKLDLKDPKKHIAYYEIIDDKERLIVHLKSGQTFYYPYSKEQERHILEIIKNQIEYSNQYKEQLKRKKDILKFNITAGSGVTVSIQIMNLLFCLNSVTSIMGFIQFTFVLFGIYSSFYFYQKHKINKIDKKIERIELLEDVMTNNLLKDNNYSKENIFSNTSSKTRVSIHKESLTKNDIINEIGRLSLDIKNLKDLKTIVENIQHTNILNQNTEKEEKKYLKK